MLATDRVKSRKPLLGSPRPRIAPPLPARSDVAAFKRTVSDIGMEIMPWQVTAARYIEALGPGSRHLYREVALIVARQNGKSTILVPLIVKRLLEGERIMHTAQDRNLPREVFDRVADVMWRFHSDLFPLRNGRPTKPRYANGQEEIRLSNGAIYRLVAPTSSGGRGPSCDLVIVDELREHETWEFIQAARFTLKASKHPQFIYLSNAGFENSLPLNAIRARREEDPELAYLEWSADPALAADDPVAWSQSNPGMGHEVGEMGPIYESLVADLRRAVLEGTMNQFETEDLCRWVISMQERLVQPEEWSAQEFGPAGHPARPVMAVKMDIDGERAAAVVSWLLPDNRVALAVVADVTGAPIDVTLLGPALVAKAAEWRASVVAFDPYTDTDLVRYFRRSEKVMGRDYANASEGFARRAAARQFVVDDDAGAIARDLDHTTRHHGQFGTWIAVKSQQPNPVAEAAIRAAWLASKPSSAEVARIY